ncbi:hypothetical protein CDAR_292331 [Caerostris darwini]|uniref:Uncharacterized protein n=1 Tax=Caerostris darwini TaxID=1538125 RepID=A0AAV4UD18_9ARAC|nr:hypothetical protein CDAR_292331 [Caerostris darwini]
MNPTDEPQRDLLLLKYFRQHKGFNASTMDKQCNDGVMKIYHLLKRWWLFHELPQPDSRMPLVVNSQRKGEESFGPPFLMLLLDTRGGARGDGSPRMCIYQVDSFDTHQTVSKALFIMNPKDEPQRDLLLLKHFRHHKGFNASTIDEQRNDGVMKMHHLLKRWWLFPELTQPYSRMPLVVCIHDCHCFFWHRDSICLRHET